MAITIAGGNTALRWGDEANQVFDYYPHSTRDTGGNPVLIYRHPGGGDSGNYQSVWTESSRWKMYFMQYVHDTTGLDLHFDVISVETAQRSWDASFAAGKKSFILQQIADAQRCIIALKRMGVRGIGSSSYKLDPSKFILMGDSHGSNLWSLSQVMPPLIEMNNRTSQGYGEPGIAGGPRIYASVDTSSAAGVIYYIGQPDVRSAAMAYTNLGGWFGCSVTDGGTQIANIPTQLRESVSLQWYLEQGLTRYWCPHYVAYATTGAHTKPYSNAHDSQQGTDLVTAIQAKNLPLAYNIGYSEADWATATSSYHAHLYGWCAKTVRAYSGGIGSAFPAVGGPS